LGVLAVALELVTPRRRRSPNFAGCEKRQNQESSVRHRSWQAGALSPPPDFTLDGGI
jgi:hypothetical protein